MRNHPFYKWGYGKVVFDDVGQMIESLKHFEPGQNGKARIGDFSAHISEVAPFHDGRGNERIGGYLCALLEKFENGASREDAIASANEKFRSDWGQDKIVDLPPYFGKS